MKIQVSGASVLTLIRLIRIGSGFQEEPSFPSSLLKTAQHGLRHDQKKNTYVDPKKNVDQKYIYFSSYYINEHVQLL